MNGLLPEPITIAFFFVLGTAIGSFLNVWSRRLLRGEPITGRSHCESCGHPLSVFDLVPLFSFLILRGRCRYCHQPLSWQYPLVEVGTGLLFAALAFTDGLISYGVLLISVSALIIIFITDFSARLIFDEIVILGVISALAYRMLFRALSGEPVLVLLDLLGALAVFVFFSVLRSVTSGKGLGEGDPPLGFLTALLVGFPLLLVQFFLAFIFGAAVGVVLVAMEKKHLKDRIAFGPFLVVAAFATLLFGDQIWSWYLSQLGL